MADAGQAGHQARRFDVARRSAERAVPVDASREPLYDDP